MGIEPISHLIFPKNVIDVTLVKSMMCLPVVCAERTGRNAILVVEVGLGGVHGETVANGDRLGYVR